MRTTNRFDFIVPAAVVAVFVALGLTGLMDRLEGRLYDTFLHVKPAVPESPNILLLDVDDLSISKVGVWPWPRDIMANGLILMREFGAGYAVFDIQYLDKSPRGVDSFLLRQTLPDSFNQEFAQIQTNMEQLFTAMKTGSIPMRDAGRYLSELEGLAAMSKLRLLETAQSAERDNDAYLGQAARFFGSAYLTVNAPDEKDDAAPADMEQYALDHLAQQGVIVVADPVVKAGSLQPAILPVIQGAAGVGFPNVVLDEDGVRRRIDLLKSYKGKYFSQLAFHPLLNWLGNPAIVLHRGDITLKAARLPDKTVKDIRIPLDSKGRLLINWPKRVFLKTFRHLSYYELVLHRQLEEDLLYNLRLMSQSGYLSYYGGETGLLDIYQYAEGLKKEVLEEKAPSADDASKIQEYVQVREHFFTEAAAFLSGDAQAAIIADIDKAVAGKKLSAEESAHVEAVRADVPTTFESTRGIMTNLLKTREILAKNLPGSFCLIGNTATSNTDLGVNPFERSFPNVGTHAAVVNTILQGRFLNEAPWWVPILLALLFAFGSTFICMRLDSLRSTIVGLAIVVVLVVLFILLFLSTGVYVQMIAPVMSVFFTFIVLTVVKFLRAEREKTFVRNAFGHYLSNDVINDLLENPDKLVLGGEKKVLTAMFTDVKGFSTISEVLDPSELVRLLNQYLSEMSDIIMDLRGTIDKYEGDAIISFFGAPLDFKDHAHRACLAAIRMRRMEEKLNERFLAEKLAPSELHTRIGVNTGEMVVGNMGTIQKMDYTIMGSSVNLASRLEGVNKQYGTWIMVSETTMEEGGAGFLTRKLDRVRVVGINKPVRLFELVEEDAAVDPRVRQGVQAFHEALDLFEAKKWQESEPAFQRVLESLPDDGPAKLYLKRCQEFSQKAPAENWDGVFNLTMK